MKILCIIAAINFGCSVLGLFTPPHPGWMIEGQINTVIVSAVVLVALIAVWRVRETKKTSKK